jgi:hypothetical protein
MQKIDVKVGMAVRDRWWPENTGKITGASPKAQSVTVSWLDGTTWRYDCQHLQFLESMGKKARHG